MPNIEIKARYASLEEGRKIAERLQARPVGVLHQIDTYFQTSQGKLKLREIEGQGAWLIPYNKTYEKRPARSDYQLLEVKNAEATKQLFTELLGQKVVVDKSREVFLIENIRVHLDRVLNLGNFLEFEAVFEIDTAAEREKQIQKVKELMSQFGITSEHLVTEGYSDLLL